MDTAARDFIEDVSDDEKELLLAHFSLNEIEELSQLGGIEIVPPELTDGVKVWDLTGLDPILRDPQVLQNIKEILFEEERQEYAAGGRVSELSDEIRRIKESGRMGDKELAIITDYMLEIFVEMSGGKISVNPETGLPEFFKLKKFAKNIVRSVAPIIGAYFGGPIGAGVATAASRKLTGDSWSNSLKRGAIVGGATYIGGRLMGNMGGQGGGMKLPGMGGGFQLPGMGGGSGAQGGGFMSNIGSGFNNLMSGFSGSGGSQAAGAAGSSGGGGGLMSGIGGMMGRAAPMAGAAFMMNRGRQQENRATRNHEQGIRDQDTQDRARSGFDAPFRYGESPSNEYRPNPDEFDPETYNQGNYPFFVRRERERTTPESHKSGGIIGKGKGQQDNIQRHIPKNSYIIDASTVSDIGDGSTHAGMMELDKYFGKCFSKTQKKAKGGMVKALVSSGEYQISPDHVAKLGNGSFAKGEKLLNKMVNDVRSEKRSSGKKLPPKSKSVGGYISKIKSA